MKNFRRDIEGKLVSYLPSGPVFCCFAASPICKGCKFLGAHKERTLALFFFVVEAVSVVLDLIGTNKEAFLLAAFLLSAFGFAITLYACVEEKTNTKTLAERQLKVVEFVFSVIQLGVTFFQFLLTVLQVKNSYNASAFPLAFATIAVVFIFKKSGNIDDCDDHSLPKDCLLPLVNLQPIISPIELDLTAETSSPNQVNPTSPLIKRSAHASDVATCNDHPANDHVTLSKNIEVLVPEYGVQRAIDLIVFTSYKELCKELKTMFSIPLYFNKRPKSHWELYYEDDNGEMFLVGDYSWDEFYHNVRKLYLYKKKKSLRKNFTVEPPQQIYDDVSPPPLPAKTGEKIDDCEDHSLPRDCLLPLVNLQPIDPVPISTPIELDLTETSPNQVNPTNPLIKRSTHASDVAMCNDHPVDDHVVLSKNIEVLVPECGVQRAFDLFVFTCYTDLYKELKTMFSIPLYFNKRTKSHWELIYEDDNGDMFLVGDYSWDVFYHNVRKLYLYKKKSLRNNIMLKRPQLIHDDVSPPPATLPSEQKTIMEPVAAYNPHSSSHILNDIDIEVASNIAQPAPAPGSVL
ncbi:hypothetical protein Q3G72_022680 [Acer saccharum]|nr:hypothetical protein Q3G72_022680 [Acer saccharum]